MIITPIQNFELISDKEYCFTDTNYKLRRFVPEVDIVEIDLYSKQDLDYMKNTRWAIEVMDENTKDFISEINLIMISIKIFFRISPYVKYIICKNNLSKCRKLNESICYTNTESYEDLNYNDLKKVDYGFEALKEMRKISFRTYYAIFFLYRGFFSFQWIDSFIFLVCAIESLFSKNTPGGNTKKICSRVARFLKSDYYNEDKINEMYSLRSDLIHGTKKPSNDSKNNIEKVSELEELVIQIMQKVLNDKIYYYFKIEESRSHFFSSLK